MCDAANPLAAARAEALFVSYLSVHSHPTGTDVAAAIKHAVRAWGGTRRCAGEVAAAYGDYPETAPTRMRWACRLVADTYPRRAARVGPPATVGPTTAVNLQLRRAV